MSADVNMNSKMFMTHRYSAAVRAVGNQLKSELICSVSLLSAQGKQQDVYGDAAKRTGSPGQPDRCTQIKT